jgi:hypothetical protein
MTLNITKNTPFEGIFVGFQGREKETTGNGKYIAT